MLSVTLDYMILTCESIKTKGLVPFNKYCFRLVNLEKNFEGLIPVDGSDFSSRNFGLMMVISLLLDSKSNWRNLYFEPRFYINK